MKNQLENIGIVGTVLTAIAGAAPCCLPLLATLGGTVGLSVLQPFQEQLNYLLMAFVLIALVGHVKAYAAHHNVWLLGLSIISSIALLGGYSVNYTANIIYPGLLGLLVATAWHFFISRNTSSCVANKVNLQSVIICPECGFKKEETMPTDSCLFFYNCANCNVLLKPKQGNCCVFCSYGNVKCPPIQINSCLCH